MKLHPSGREMARMFVWLAFAAVCGLALIYSIDLSEHVPVDCAVVWANGDMDVYQDCRIDRAGVLRCGWDPGQVWGPGTWYTVRCGDIAGDIGGGLR